MRTLPILMVVGVLILTVGTATAESLRQENDPMAAYETQNSFLGSHGHATLKLSPMFLEIHRINEETVVTEQALLKRLAICQDELEVQRLVSQLAQLATNRQLSVLRIRVKYARLEGRYDLAFRLRQEMLQLMQTEVASLL